MAKVRLINGGGIGLESYRDDFSVDRFSEWTKENQPTSDAYWTWDTTNNRLEFNCVGNNAYHSCLLLNDLEVADVNLRITLTQAHNVGLIFRYQDVNNFYFMRFSDDSGSDGGSDIKLLKCVNGVVTALASHNIGWARGDTRSFEVVVVGSSIHGYMDGFRRIAVTDSTFPDKGRIGFRVNGAIAPNYVTGLQVFPATPELIRATDGMDMFLCQLVAARKPRMVTPTHWTKNLLTLNQSTVETDTTGFSNVGTNTYTRVSNWSAHGAYSLRIQDATSNSDWAGVSPIQLRTGYPYIASATVYNPNAVPITVYMNISGNGQTSVTLQPGEEARIQTVPWNSTVTGTGSIRFYEATGLGFNVGKLMFEQKSTFASGWIPGGTVYLQPDDGEDHFVEGTDNICPYSQYFTHSSWSKSNVTASRVQYVEDPVDGVMGGVDLITENTVAGASHTVSRLIQYQAGNWYTVSAFVKPNGRKKIKLIFSSYVSWTGGLPEGWFDIETGTVLNANGNLCRIWREDHWPEGWYRCSLSVLNLGTTHTSNVNVQLLNDSNQNTYTGDGNSGIYLFGVQVEAKAYATDYQPSGPGNTHVRPNQITGILAGTTNLLTSDQSSFTTSTAGWQANTGTKISRTTEDARTGNHCLYVQATSTGTTRGCFTSTRIAVTPGKKYTASVFMKNRTMSDVAIYMEVYWYDAATGGSQVGTRGLGPTKFLSPYEWQRLYATGEAPVGATHALVTVYTINQVNSAHSWYMDDCQFEEGSVPTDWIEGGATRARSGETKALMIEESGDNHVRNGNFLTDASSWTVSNGPGMNGTSARVWDDDLQAWCLEWTISTAGSWGILLGSIGFHAFDLTKQYTISMKIKKIDGPNSLSVAILKSDGTNVVLASGGTSTVDLTGCWIDYERTFTPALVGTNPQLYFTMSAYAPGVVQTFRIAFVKLEQKAYKTSFTLHTDTMDSEKFILPLDGIVSANKGKIRMKFRADTRVRQDGSARFLWDFGGTGTTGFFAEFTDTGGLYFKAGTGSALTFVATSEVKARHWHEVEFEWSETQLSVTLDGGTPQVLEFTNGIVINSIGSIGHRLNSANSQSMDGCIEYFEIENEDGTVYRLDFSNGEIDPEVEAVWTSGWRQNKHRTVIKEVELSSNIPEGSYVNMKYAASVDGTEANLTDWTSDLRSLPDVSYLKYRAELVGKPQTAAPKLTQIKVTPV